MGHFAQAIGGERIVLKRRGKEVAAIISIDELRRLEEMEDRTDIAAARRALKEKGFVPIAEVKKRLGMK